MKESESTQKNQDGLLMYTHHWEPETEVRGAIILVHGLGEHCTRYHHVAEKLTAAGFSLIGFDHRGHGRTEGKRGHIPSYAKVMSDIQAQIDLARQKHSGKPIFLYGHSMGGNFSLYYLLTQKTQLAGAIVTSPGLAVANPVPPATLFLGKIMSKLNPSMSMPNGLDRSGLSRDPEVEKVYSADPLVHGIISAKLAIDMLSNGQWIIAHASELATPLLLMQGSADRLVSPAATQSFASKVTYADFEYKVWDGYYHELHNEPDKSVVLQTMVNWLEKHL